MRLVPDRACAEFPSVVDTLGCEHGIPRFEEVNDRLGAVTGRESASARSGTRRGASHLPRAGRFGECDDAASSRPGPQP